MKSLIITVLCTVFFGCFFGKAQSINQQSSATSAPFTPTSSQLEVRGNRLITQNFLTAPIGSQTTGNFTTNSRWNSMGSLTTPNQTLNGFRTQTDGRGLTLGYSVPTGGSVGNPTIQWIGSIGVAGGNVPQGNLEFRYAANPTIQNGDLPIFVMAPTASTTVPSFNYAAKDAFVGQLQSGSFGSFGVGDTWSATGQIFTPSPIPLTSYGARQQYKGSTLITGLLENSASVDAVIDYGASASSASSPAFKTFKFRSFTDPLQPSSVKNIWQSNLADGNVMMGRQDISAVNANQFYLSVYDGAPVTLGPTFPVPDNLPVQRAGIYSTSSTITDAGVQLLSYAAIVGDLRFATPGQSFQKFAILGLAEQTNPKNNWAGYFVGNVGYTGALLQISDKKFKTAIEPETNIMEKLMQLAPKHYYFDTKKYAGMAFSDQLQHGLISQEVEKIFPELVIDAAAPVTSAGEKGKTTEYKAINYNAFIPMLIKGLQEQQAQIEELKNQLKSSNTLVLTDKLNLPTEIENKAFTLSQNTPNPFSEKTTISYTIPNNVSKATLAVFDLTGKMLLQYNLVQGKNQLTINGSTLPAGMYLYSLLANGQEVLSKRMVLTK